MNSNALIHTVRRGMTKYRIDRVHRILPALAKRHCTALRHATNYREVAGEAGVQTVGADVLFECPHCLRRRENGTYDWSVPLCKLKNNQSPGMGKMWTCGLADLRTGKLRTKLADQVRILPMCWHW